MKKVSSFILAVVLCFTATTSFAAATAVPIETNTRGTNAVDLEYGNLLLHGDMEQTGDGTYPSLPLGWEWPYDNTAGALTADVTQSSSVFATGSKSLKVDLSALPDNSGLMFAQGAIDVNPGEKYVMQGRFNVTSINKAKVTFYIRWVDASGEEIKIDAATPIIATTSGFAVATKTVTAPVNAATAEVRFSFVGTGDAGSIVAYVDSLVFIRNAYVYNMVISRNGKDIYSGTSNFYTDSDIAESNPINYEVRYYAQNGDLLDTQNTSVNLGDSSGEQGDVSTTVIGGSLSMTPGPTTFSAVVLDTEANSLISTATGSIKTKDNRGDGKGWSVKSKGTNFISDFLADPSSNGSSTYRLSIGVSALSIIPGEVAVNAGQAIDATNGPLVSPITLTDNLQTLILAKSGFGMGSYTVPLTFNLNVPKTVTVAAQTGTGSKHTIGSSVGTVATVYRSTITYIVGVGL
ncbi:hypothetical protein [Paenibacillus sp. FSL P4-0288]|uniref:hypothetical protein n=1 Tax=Paenibacillus sp. FSL P4-0288 TaxID=2921633 RepID=UPI0030FBEC0B